MAGMNLGHITDKLNTEFAAGGSRRLVFWYDKDAEFDGEINGLELENAKILRLERGNQFYIKQLIERVDTETNYLIYAPFAKPDIKDNHLADTILYSKEFYADRVSLIMNDYGIDESLRSVIAKHVKFFAAKDRTERFENLLIEKYDNDNIRLGMMSALCRLKTCSFEEILRCVLTGGELENNAYLAEFEKYGLTDDFWQIARDVFGYADSEPTLGKLVIALFVTYAARVISCEIPAEWRSDLCQKPGSVIAFLDNMMNNTLCAERFDELSAFAYNAINGRKYFAEMQTSAVATCYIFAGIDEIIIDWMIERLNNADISARLGGRSIDEICEERQKKHFGKLVKNEYSALMNARGVISAEYRETGRLDDIVDHYTKEGYKIDSSYRRFYYYFDKIEEPEKFKDLRKAVEYDYVNNYLNRICVDWAKAYVSEQAKSETAKQTEFYSNNVRYTKERTAVIISDALRYEVGRGLFERLQSDEKCEASITPMQSVLPSITSLGMAALLPHKSIELNPSRQALIDGKPCDDLRRREAVLKAENPKSRCVQYDNIKNMNKAELREIFTGQDVVYIYHNQIDARGDKANTENEVFAACEEAIEEICALIRRLTSSANTIHYIVTADHGFIYKRDKLAESDKIENRAAKDALAEDALAEKRYIISDEAENSAGVLSLPISTALNGDDERIISFPMGSDIFKVPGNGLNYVHGGCSPQEMIVPLIDVKTKKNSIETTDAKIELVSILGKVTNLILSLDFIQTKPVSDIVKKAEYRIYFVADDGEKISNEHIYIADKKDEETEKRIFRLSFTLKNKKYDRSKKYYLVAVDEKHGVEVIRRETVIDIAFAGDFGFGF